MRDRFIGIQQRNRLIRHLVGSLERYIEMDRQQIRRRAARLGLGKSAN